MTASEASSRIPDTLTPGPRRTVEQLDTAIVELAQHVAAASYRLLLLVREFDDRLGWAKWSFPSCAEWLSWRCGLSLSAAREKVRTAHALRGLPEISRAFAAGRLSYTKVRALTRVANAANEDLLLAYALGASAPQVEERCRQMRNTAADSVELARRAWERRSSPSCAIWQLARCGSLSKCRSRTVSSSRTPSIARSSRGRRSSVPSSRPAAGGRNRPMRLSRWPGPIWARVRRLRQRTSRAGRLRRTTIRWWSMWTIRPSAEGRGARICPSRRSGA